MNIVLFGAGYIGLALAAHLSQNHLTLVTKTPHPEFSEHTHYSFDAGEEPLITQSLHEADVVICTVAKNENDYSMYPNVARFIMKYSKDAFHIYTSSIGVYGNHQGEVAEQDECTPATEREKHLLAAENIFLQQHTACVLRLGGIYGPGRSLLSRILQRGKITGPKEWPINMVHKDDVIGAILFALETPLHGIYNVVTPSHPSREVVYQEAARAQGERLPPWDESAPIFHGGNKIVSSNKILERGFRFIYNTLKYDDF